MRIKTGVIMLNMGGPKSLHETRPYLYNLFNDEEIINLPLKRVLAPTIAFFRGRALAKKYNLIGGGSPIHRWTDQQGAAMAAKLDVISPDTGMHQHYIGFRYTPPFLVDSLEQAAVDGVDHIVLFSQYPQYSCTTAGSSINQAVQLIQQNPKLKNIKITLIDRWYSNPLFISAFVRNIRLGLNNFAEEHRDSIPIVFTSHSIPMSVVKKGDTYPYEIASTVDLIMRKFNSSNPYFMGWQSKVGYLPWLQPDLKYVLSGLVKSKKYENGILIVPVSFTSDHIETLYDIDIDLLKFAKEKLKCTFIARAPMFNSQEIFTTALAEIVKGHLINHQKPSPQFFRRCPHCINPKCEESRNFLNI